MSYQTLHTKRGRPLIVVLFILVVASAAWGSVFGIRSLVDYFGWDEVVADPGEPAESPSKISKAEVAEAVEPEEKADAGENLTPLIRAADMPSSAPPDTADIPSPITNPENTHIDENANASDGHSPAPTPRREAAELPALEGTDRKAVRRYMNELHITGMTSSRLMVGEKIFRIGDYLDAKQQVKLQNIDERTITVRIDGQEHTLTF